jgi:hypothetical protein
MKVVWTLVSDPSAPGLWFLSASFGELLFTYICIASKREGNSISLPFLRFFTGHPRSDAKALVLDISVTEAFPSRETITNTLLTHGLQPRAIQGMLDFDYSFRHQAPSVAAMVYPFGGHHIQRFSWGTKETLLPVYTSLKEAVSKHPVAIVVM